MPSEFERNLDRYADVIVKVGLNLQPGQRLLIIGTPGVGIYGVQLELAPLVRLVATKAYQAGARLVEVLWGDDQLRLIRLQHAPRDSFGEAAPWRAKAAIDAAEAGDAVLFVVGTNPHLLAGQDPELLSSVRLADSKLSKPFGDLRRRNATNCAVVTGPVDGWPDVVFPDLPPRERESRFWDAVFEICRVNQPDPVAAWQSHVRELTARRDHLNRQRNAALRLTAPGTDLTVGLPQGHVWGAAGMTSPSGIDYMVNIPTEEIFTIPHRHRAEGVVTSTRPLNYGGSLIEELRLTFSEGHVVEATARRGEETLHRLLAMGRGVSRLGEVALVPHSSPISQLGLVFYNTLIDENAASHIALGQALRFCLEDGETMADEEFAAAGGNTSLVHVDFMIGSAEMDVDGIAEDGRIEPVMRSGEWAFEL